MEIFIQMGFGNIWIGWTKTFNLLLVLILLQYLDSLFELTVNQEKNREYWRICWSLSFQAYKSKQKILFFYFFFNSNHPSSIRLYMCFVVKSCHSYVKESEILTKITIQMLWKTKVIDFCIWLHDNAIVYKLQNRVFSRCPRN